MWIEKPWILTYTFNIDIHNPWNTSKGAVNTEQRVLTLDMKDLCWDTDLKVFIEQLRDEFPKHFCILRDVEVTYCYDDGEVAGGCVVDGFHWDSSPKEVYSELLKGLVYNFVEFRFTKSVEEDIKKTSKMVEMELKEEELFEELDKFKTLCNNLLK